MSSNSKSLESPHKTSLLGWAIVVPLLTLILTILIASGVGPVNIPVVDVVWALFNPADPDTNVQVIWQIRLPRTLLAALVGAALAGVGVVMQAVFRNPLAEPGITGASSGAALGAVTLLVFFPVAETSIYVAIFAYLGSAIAMVLLLGISRRQRHGVSTLILVGISINAIAGALIALLITNAPNEASVRGVMAWLNGSLTARAWNDVAIVFLPILIGLAFLITRNRWLDTLLLGDATALTSGVNPNRARTILLIVSAVVTGAAVSVSGIITFVGLVAPHAVRIVLGAAHKRLMPASILWGAVFLVLADTIARAELFRINLQTGIVVAIIGAPVFLYLILKNSGEK